MFESSLAYLHIPDMKSRKCEDLSSFAMLLLEADVCSENRIDSPDIHLQYQSSDGIPLTPINNGRGIRNFFRKRHKSVGSSSNQPPVGVYQCQKEDSPSLAPGSKIRNLFGSMRQRSKSDLMSPDNISTSVPKCAFKMESENPLTDLDLENGKIDDGYGSVPRSMHSNVYKTSRSNMMARRSCSVRDSTIGPNEFLEMYRSRAYSDTTQMSDTVRKLRQRRFSASPPYSQSPKAEYCAFEPNQLIIWKDNTNGTQVFRLPSTEEEEKAEDIESFVDNFDDLIYLRFLKIHAAYDVIPTSTKMVVLDTQLNVKKAFYALVHNSIRAAPLWDTKRQDFIGMLTITDFIHVLLKYHKAKDCSLDDIEDHSISYWMDILSAHRNREFVFTQPKVSMFDAVCMLCLHKIHRLPIIDPETGNILYSLTHKRILRYVYMFFQFYKLPQPSFMNQSVGNLRVGSYNNIATVHPDTPLVDALELFLTRRVSSLPVVDFEGKLLGIFAKYHMMDLAAEKTYANLNYTVEQTINGKGYEPVATCLKTDLYSTVVERIVKTEVHHLIVVDELGHVEGMISVSDVMNHLVLCPPITAATAKTGLANGSSLQNPFVTCRLTESWCY